MVNKIRNSIFITVFSFGAVFISLLVHEGIHIFQDSAAYVKSICYDFGMKSWMHVSGEIPTGYSREEFIGDEFYREKVATTIPAVFVLSLVFVVGFLFWRPAK